MAAALRPMNNIAAPAIAIEIAAPGDDLSQIASTAYQEQVAQSIAAGVAAVRGKMTEVRP
jgi:N-acetylmuramoyl-L-alanine amidase